MRKIVTVTTDDLTGEILTGDVQELVISINGEAVKLDLDLRTLNQFKSLAGAFLAAGEPVKNKSKRKATDPIRNRSIRRWAASNGYKISARGRIPNLIIEAFDAAHAKEIKRTLQAV